MLWSLESPETRGIVQPGSIDVLIITAVEEEYHAVRQVDAGTLPGSGWQEQSGPIGLDVAFRSFETKEDRPLHVAVTQAPGMAGSATINAAVPLVIKWKPQCIAMCGVCAGRPSKVSLGDVIIADRTWYYDSGKRESKALVGTRRDNFHPDPSPTLLDYRWQQKAERFFKTYPPCTEEWLRLRPRSFEVQSNWLLERIFLKEDPNTHRERLWKCPQLGDVIRVLWDKKWLEPNSLHLTDEGRKYIEMQRLLYPDGIPEPQPFKVHMGPMGSGNAVVEDDNVFSEVTAQQRKALAIEMEAAAIGEVARYHDVPLALIMKGAMDYADGGKNDHFKAFAARASAECLIAFLRAHPPLSVARATSLPAPMLSATPTSKLSAGASQMSRSTAGHVSPPSQGCSAQAGTSLPPSTTPVPTVMSYAAATNDITDALEQRRTTVGVLRQDVEILYPNADGVIEWNPLTSVPGPQIEVTPGLYLRARGDFRFVVRGDGKRVRAWQALLSTDSIVQFMQRVGAAQCELQIVTGKSARGWIEFGTPRDTIRTSEVYASKVLIAVNRNTEQVWVLCLG